MSLVAENSGTHVMETVLLSGTSLLRSAISCDRTQMCCSFISSNPTNPKNDGLRTSWDDEIYEIPNKKHIKNIKKKHIKTMFQTKKNRWLLSLLLFSMFPKILRRHVLPLRPICRGSSCETKRPPETASDPPVVYVGQTASDHLGMGQNPGT